MTKAPHSNDLCIVIDMQQGFRYPEATAILPQVQQLVERFPGQVVLSLFRNEPGSFFETRLRWKKMQREEERALMPELDRALLPRFWHSGYTVLTPELVQYIEAYAPDRVYIAGIYTDVCVLHTALSAADHGWHTLVVRDCCASLHGYRHHVMALETLLYALGEEYMVPLQSLLPQEDSPLPARKNALE
ncbi:cysteine hydrolase [Candidatus Peribacteria bacterium]|nr:cysteine hydrolase [Candidatus Peribacteria bacterium]